MKDLKLLKVKKKKTIQNASKIERSEEGLLRRSKLSKNKVVIP
jgi:hypothetical protein